MSFVRFKRSAATTAVALGTVMMVSGCATPAQPLDPIASESPSPSATATPPADSSPEPPYTMVIDAVHSDIAGSALTVHMELLAIEPVTDALRQSYDERACVLGYPMEDFARADARVVTFAVTVSASDGFAGWSDARGVRVSGGTIFDGPIWEEEAHGAAAPCASMSRIVRPGSGSVSYYISPSGWSLADAYPGDSAATLGSFGTESVIVDALGQATGMTRDVTCSIEVSPEFDELAVALSPDGWGDASVLPEYCFYGRSPVH